MKRFLFGTWLLISAGICDAENQTSNYLWPIKGAEAGENIICAPQGYIGDEFNFDYLFIGAEEGTTVLAPAASLRISASDITQPYINRLAINRINRISMKR